MAIEHITGIANRIEDLKRKLAARQGRSEYKENEVAIRAEIERLEKLLEEKRMLASESPKE